MIDIETALNNIKEYRKTINKRQSKKQDIIATQTCRTYHELILENIFKYILFDKIDINNIYIDNIFCFFCNKFFQLYSFKKNMEVKSGHPYECYHCKKRYSPDERGQYSKPDILIHDPETNNTLIVYVNGKMHEKDSKRIKRDYHQFKHLLEHNVKVVVITNDMVESYSTDMLTAFCKFCYDCVNDDNLYMIYKYSAENFQRIVKPLIR